MPYLDILEEISIAARVHSLPQDTNVNSSRFVLVTVGTFAYRDYVRNLACSLLRFKATFDTDLLLLSLDSRLHAAPMPPNVRSVLFHQSSDGAAVAC